MKRPPIWFRAFVRGVGTLFPRLLVGLLFRAFWNLQPRMGVRPEATSVYARARRETVSLGARSAVVYRWGTGSSTILLVHGWRGRATQFAALVEALESPDRTIVGFDAPGNGEAPGDRTDLRDYLAAIRNIQRESGGFDLIVGHSFGVIGAFVAVREGVHANRMVSIAGIAEIDYTFETFVRATDVPRRLAALLRRKIQRDVFEGDSGIWDRFASRLDPADQTPLLVIHDRDDRAIDLSQSELIAAAHPGATITLFTRGLGHTRVLSDPEVLRAIADFANAPAQTRSAAASPENQ